MPTPEAPPEAPIQNITFRVVLGCGGRGCQTVFTGKGSCIDNPSLRGTEENIAAKTAAISMAFTQAESDFNAHRLEQHNPDTKFRIVECVMVTDE